ncbi:uncharacterized protein IUM83_14299 [Phytophthora cinnamomi]|uniref:SEP1 n=1 Tax=Phytophthora cinnamomi TaxID=4785 RepID=A0A7U3NTI7_PHYCI|nr:hypothetical protein IUM83_15101 [Phytophthora cinnamomi]KAG6609169.1 hypothetical protein IUM83_13490 [Phytophthora cinnamomi]KAG6611854.1 hypothetical protein IUM83_14299 [Phytophthora cinnamomi]KAJ8524583.1 hypothetical protein ON010_g16535 [Phytophthora cinnamomi]QOW95970.1 SEP1 [Phytophthora cinnamomi]
MQTRRWCVVALLVIATLDFSGAAPEAEATTNQDSKAGHVQAAGNDTSATVKPGRNGYGTVTYDGSASSDSGEDSEVTANRLALEEAQKQHPHLRLRLGIGI